MMQTAEPLESSPFDRLLNLISEGVPDAIIKSPYPADFSQQIAESQRHPPVPAAAVKAKQATQHAHRQID